MFTNTVNISKFKTIFGDGSAFPNGEFSSKKKGRYFIRIPPSPRPIFSGFLFALDPNCF